METTIAGLITFLIIAFILVFAALLFYFIYWFPRKKNKKQISDSDLNFSSNQKSNNGIKYNYVLKSKYVTNCELRFARVISEIIGDKYLLLPQVSLASIIEKPNSKYRNELFRIIDFAIFTLDYRPLLCIEINDVSHNLPYRRVRDHKVKDILEAVGMPLITFWSEFGVNEDYIRKCLSTYLILSDIA